VAEPTVRLTSAQALVRFLRAQWSERDGVRRRAIPAVWGIFGHGNVCGLGEALATLDGGLDFHQPKHEQAMVHAALGFAKASRRLATHACTASLGPGATNLVTGAATATTNRLPVLLLPADTFANRRQGPVLQQLEHPSYADWGVNECLRPVSRHFDRIGRPEQLITALPEAMRVLLEPAETGAVTLALHQDVQGEAYDFPVALFAERTWHVPRRPPAAEELARAAALLRRARRPLVIAGGGVRHSEAEAELAVLADRCALPVAETSAGKGSYRGPLLVGGIGVNGMPAANAVAAEADVVLCVGTRLSDFTTASHAVFQAPGVRFVHLNVCAADAAKLGAAPLVGDARAGLRALAEALGDWRAPAAHAGAAASAAERWRRDLAAALEPRPGERMSQGRALRELNDRIRPGDWVVAAAGSVPGDLLKTWEVAEGTYAHIEFAFSCMGHELPAALGIRLAQPRDGQVFAVIGDGTYLMAMSELVTAVQEGLDVTVVLFVNGGYQSIHGLQEGAGGPSFGNEFRRRDAAGGAPAGALVEVDYAANARSLGATAFEAGDPGELAAALERARATRGPVVIACRVEPRRALPASGAFWDLGLAQVSSRAEVREAAAAHAAAAGARRSYLEGGA
jgi:3D-(3,5/4)-trihydroxycyclohexane-1,2-dione acylhydrolase (decyclizing)